MAYEKPEVLAQNDKQGSFAAGCPPQRQDGTQRCENCETTV